MNEIKNIQTEQQPIFNLAEDSNDDVELGLALLGLSAVQLSRTAKTSLGASVDENSEVTAKDKDYDFTMNANKDWGYMGSAATGGTRFNPNDKDPNFNTEFDPKNVQKMMWQIQQMIAWMKANNMNLNAIPEFLAFFESMGEQWKNISAEDRAKLMGTLNNLLSADGQSICKMLIDAMVQGAFYRDGKDAAKQTAQDLMNLFAGYSYIDNPWFQRFYESAKWAYEHVDELKPGMSFEKWAIGYEGQWGRFLNQSNGDLWINMFYQQQIAEIMKLGNPELIVLMLMNLMINRDDDGQTALGGLGGVSERLTVYVDKIRNLSAQFRAGDWNEAKAKEFCETLEDIGFLLDNNPNLDAIKGQVNGALSFFLNFTDPSISKDSIGDLMLKKDFATIAKILQSQVPDPTKPNNSWEFYNNGNQSISDLGSAVSSISQLTGQTMNTMQGTNQQREGFISAYLKGLTDLMSRINNNSKASRS